MALTRKQLAAMGIEAEKIDEIIKAHTETVNEIKDERDTYQSEAKELEKVKTELDSLKEELKQGDRSPYKKKFEELTVEKEKLEKEFESFKADIEAKETKTKQRDAYRKLLSDSGVPEKFIDFVLKNAEADNKFGSLEFDDKGEVKDSEAFKKSIGEDYKSFIPEQKEQGANTPKPPANENGNQPGGLSRAAQLAARYHANLYGAKED